MAPSPAGKLENQLESALAVPDRDQFAFGSVVYLVLIHAGALMSAWYTTWSAVGICLLLHAICGGLGICVGYHRLLTHRSFKCSPALEYTLALLGSLCLEGDPSCWVAQHRQHHQYPDQPGDPHSAREGFWWSHMLWIAWAPSKDSVQKLERRYVPDLLRVPFYQLLSRLWVVPSIVLGAALYLLGGAPFLLWGLCVRLVFCYHSTWLVNSASHRFGYRTFPLKDLSTNCWWVALLAYGEGWHNNHHAFPTSARHGLKFWEIDLAYGFIRLLRAVGLAWDVQTVPADKLQFSSR
ncbi:MAG: acyl-CoA desaturase [Acidobacteria bacterium]|nr:MAG: acyl-CoA desaturase [Acidobacteriota bacterium]